MNPIAFHPCLLALFPILALFVRNLGQISAAQMLRPMVAALVLASLFWLFSHRLVKDLCKSSILTSLFLILFFSFGHTINQLLIALSSLGLGDVASYYVQSGTSQMIAALFWLGLFVLTSYLVKIAQHDLRPVSQFLNVFSLALVAFAAFTWFTWRAQEAPAYTYIDAWRQSVRSAEPANPIPIVPAVRPNIFYLILDEYARADILTEMYDLDNSEFYAYLTAKGFCTADQSTSNYSQSHLSLASSLNSMYLDDLANKVEQRSTNRLPLEAMIADNLLFQRLRADGYTTVAFASGYSFSELGTVDVFKSPPITLTGFEAELLQTTPIPILLKLPFLRNMDDLQRERILYIFDHLADATQLSSPVFVFAHIAVPHPPFLFGAQGEPVHPKRQISTATDGIEFVMYHTPEEYVALYRQQTIFVTTRLQSTIDAILATARGPTIIILQADHGPSSKQMVPSDEKARYAERLSIFNAVYSPDGAQDRFCSSTTPVNTFRIILNRYLGANFEILENRNYFSNYDYPYAFIDVTDRMKKSP